MCWFCLQLALYLVSEHRGLEKYFRMVVIAIYTFGLHVEAVNWF